MTTFIVREYSHGWRSPDFEDSNDAFEYIQRNTGSFEANEIVCIVDFEDGKTTFVKLEQTIVPVIVVI